MATYTKTIELRNKQNVQFLHLDKRTKKGTYKILPRVDQRRSQYDYCEKIFLRGFDRLPSGFYTNDGLGLTGAGVYLLQEFHAIFGKKIELSIVARGGARLTVKGTTTKVTIPHAELVRINSQTREIKRQKNEAIRSLVKMFLSRKFPKKFPKHKGIDHDRYSPGAISSSLERSEVLKRLNSQDRQSLEKFIPSYLSSIKGTLSSVGKLRVIYDSLDAGKVVYFNRIVKEFRRKLKSQSQSESTWQEFLSKHILVLRNSYGHVLEKESVTLKGKYPDFMLIDPYEYLDIYEIKKPTTGLLKHDLSRNNYYWDVEISKAISQVENYLHQVQRNSDGLINDIRKSKGVEINIVRPRGYIIAGVRAQLTNQKMIDDFRILNESLKNIDVILYDDLVNNLETFVKRVGPI